MNLTIITDLVKGIAEGNFGPKPKAIYWWIHDRAMFWGLLAGVLDILLRVLDHFKLCAQCGQIDVGLLATCFVLSNMGLMIGFHVAEKPDKGV